MASLLYQNRKVRFGYSWVIVTRTKSGIDMYLSKSDNAACLTNSITEAYPFNSVEEATDYIQTSMKHLINYNYPISQYKVRKVICTPVYDIDWDVDVDPPNKKAIVISGNDYLKYGCPHCGCEATCNYDYKNKLAYTIICPECYNDFIVNTEQSSEAYPAEAHPKNNSWHEFSQVNPIVNDGKPCTIQSPLGSVYVKVESRAAGSDILVMVRDIILELGGDINIKSTIVNKLNGVDGTFVKFDSADHINVDVLLKLIAANGEVVTPSIIRDAMSAYIESETGADL